MNNPFGEIPVKVFIIIFTAVFGLFTFSVKMIYDNLKKDNLVKQYREFDKIPDIWWDGFKVYNKSADTSFKRLTNYYNILKTNNNVIFKDQVFITIDFFKNELSNGVRTITNLPGDTNKIPAYFIKLFSLSKNYYKAQYQCWESFEEYCQLARVKSTSKLELDRKRNDFYMNYNNIKISRFSDEVGLQAEYDNLGSWDWGNYFWWMLGIISLVASTFLAFIGFGLYLESSRNQ